MKLLIYNLTWISDPLLQGFLQSSHVQRLTGHTDQCHYLQKFLLTGVAQLLNVVSTCQIIYHY